jgi:hypothetical protein
MQRPFSAALGGRLSQICLPVAVALALALDASAQAACGPYGRYAPLRQVEGLVTASGSGILGSRHIVVRDEKSGCRVFVLSEDTGCAPGNRFAGFGRLKSAQGGDFDAVFRFFRPPESACR